MGRPRLWKSQAEYMRFYRQRKKLEAQAALGKTPQEINDEKFREWYNGGIPEEWYQRVEGIWSGLRGLTVEDYWKMVDG